ncbi:hypothetical protein EB061_09630 [bacterium]|nr:hypothetical protein [bacterium]
MAGNTVALMNLLLKPLWVFAPISAAFAASFAYRGQGEGFLAGLLFSAFLALRFRAPIPPRRLFPIFMLFLFLLGIGHTPSRDFSPALSYTAEALIALRVLLLCLLEIRELQERPGRAGVPVLVFALLGEVLASTGLAVSTFRLMDPGLLQVLHLAHLRVFLAGALVEFAWRRLAR